MKVLTSLLLVQLALVEFISSECTSTSHCATLTSLAAEGNCDFYYEIESVRNCSAKGYPIGYGHKYWMKFGDKYESFNKDVNFYFLKCIVLFYFNKCNQKQGQVWIDSVRKCLMHKLVEEFDSLTNCVQLKNFAFTTHVECYLRPGYGAKGICDIWASKNLVGLLQTYDLLDFFKDKVALFQVNKFYLSRNIWKIVLKWNTFYF